MSAGHCGISFLGALATARIVTRSDNLLTSIRETLNCIQSRLGRVLAEGLAHIWAVGASQVEVRGLAPQIAILLAVERVNLQNHISVIIVNHFRLVVVRYSVPFVQFVVAAVFWFRRRHHCLVGVNHCVLNRATVHAVGIEDFSEFIS